MGPNGDKWEYRLGLTYTFTNQNLHELFPLQNDFPHKLLSQKREKNTLTNWRGWSNLLIQLQICSNLSSISLICRFATVLNAYRRSILHSDGNRIFFLQLNNEHIACSNEKFKTKWIGFDFEYTYCIVWLLLYVTV